VAASALAFCLFKPATAATIDFTVTFSASQFGAGAPVSTVLGQFELSFDPSADAGGMVTTNFLNLPVSSIGFTYFSGSDLLLIGGLEAGDNILASYAPDLLLAIDNFSTGGFLPLFAFGYTDPPGTFNATDGMTFVSSSPAAVTPVPAALPLFAAALGGLGLLGWRRSRSRAV
jgi:hypothetical protein